MSYRRHKDTLFLFVSFTSVFSKKHFCDVLKEHFLDMPWIFTDSMFIRYGCLENTLITIIEFYCTYAWCRRKTTNGLDDNNNFIWTDWKNTTLKLKKNLRRWIMFKIVCLYSIHSWLLLMFIVEAAFTQNPGQSKRHHYGRK